MEDFLMHNEFTAIIGKDGNWYISYCPEVPGANGQGKTIEESKASLAEAISLILEDRREDAMRGLPENTIREVIEISWKGKLSFVIYVGMAAISRGKEKAIFMD